MIKGIMQSKAAALRRALAQRLRTDEPWQELPARTPRLPPFQRPTEELDLSRCEGEQDQTTDHSGDGKSGHCTQRTSAQLLPHHELIAPDMDDRPKLFILCAEDMHAELDGRQTFPPAVHDLFFFSPH